MDNLIPTPPGVNPERPDTVRAEAACPRCGGRERFTIPCKGARGPHHAERGCAGCGRHLAWVAKSHDPAGAAAFAMPFGRFKGRPLGALDDDDLLRLVRTCRSRSVADRAALVLEARRTRR